MVGLLVGEVEIGQVEGHEGNIALKCGHVQNTMIKDVPFPNLYEAPKVGTRLNAAM